MPIARSVIGRNNTRPFRPKPFSLAAHEWWQVPRVGNSRLSDVYSTPTPPGATGPAAVISAWGGGCIDTLRRDLLIWGGGHNDYAGNEVYAFNVDTLVWRRKSLATASPANNGAETNADGSPAARHTYGALIYSAALDSMLVAAGPQGLAGSGNRSSTPWLFNCTNETPNAAAPGAWSFKDDAPTIGGGVNPNPFANVAYNPDDGFYYSQHLNGFTSFNPSASPGSQWNDFGGFESPLITDVPVCMALTTPRQIVWPLTLDAGEIFARRLDTKAYIGSETTGLPASGAINILDVAAPGIGWEPSLNQVVLWGGLATGGTDRRDVYFLDLATKAITRVAGTGDIPTAPAATGTFGRFASLSGCGAAYAGLWVLVNATTDDVYFYRAA
jgi:hypothetical protein